MKKYLLVWCMVIFMMPTFVSAVSLQETYRATVLELISLLTQQIQVLEAQLKIQLQVEARQVLGVTKVRTRTPAIDELMVSHYYGGTYTALYATYGNTLTPIDATKPQSLHKQLWNRFVTLVGEEYARTRIQEFRIYNDKNSQYDAFTDMDTQTGNWILGVNVYGIDFTHVNMWKELDTLFLHEIGHMIIDDNEGMSAEFIGTFWSAEDIARVDSISQMKEGSAKDRIQHQYYDAHTRSFVSEYASTNPLEDSVESFLFFVRDTPHSGTYLRDRKVNFFYGYPGVVSLRDRIRENL